MSGDLAHATIPAVCCGDHATHADRGVQAMAPAVTIRNAEASSKALPVASVHRMVMR